MSLLTTVERHLRRVSVAPSRFGRDAAGDPRFVFDLRRGREPRPATEARVRAFMSAKEQGAGPAVHGMDAPAMIKRGRGK
jgi:hypothetical protein